jgi:hypothetical protein
MWFRVREAFHYRAKGGMDVKTIQRGALACTCIVLGVLGGTALAAELPDGFRLEPVVGGLTQPSDVAVAPDGRILITERTTGNLLQIRMGELQPAPLCHVSVETAGEAGLLGVAVHPDFESTGWIYLYYTDLVSGSNRVVRFTVQGDSCANPLTLLDLGAGGAFLRNGGGISFGPDEKLYVATGDMEVPGDGQVPDILQAKILRLEPDGSVPEDNPTPGSLVYAIGIRDGRGVAFHPAGQVYMADAGALYDLSHDELNAVPAGGNLGWDDASGNSGGLFDDPLVSWSASPDELVGPAGLALYGAEAFPVFDSDGTSLLLNTVDDDHDRFGADHLPGVGRLDDNTEAVCVGGVNHGQVCPNPADPTFCGARDIDSDDNLDENVFCLAEDEPAEYCPADVPYGDDACGSDGTDEPDESFLYSLFMPAHDGNSVMRAVVEPGDPAALNVVETFLDSSAWPDCPTEWNGAEGGNDGWLYLVASNGGGAAAGGLYRVVHEQQAGPREVSAPGSHFPLKVARGALPGEVLIHWEDLRTDAMQPRDDGVDPLTPEREYTIWMGNIGEWSSHAPVTGFEATPGAAINGALRSATFDAPDNSYFLISGRGDNLEGSLGESSAGVDRTGYAETELCEVLGWHTPGAPGEVDWLCGRDFTLLDEAGIERSLYDFRGSPIMIDLSAVWCPPCNTEADEIEQFLHQTFKDRGGIILTVIMDDAVGGIDRPDGRPAIGDCIAWGDRAGSENDHTFVCMADTVEGNYGPQAAWPLYGTGYLPTNVILDSGLRVIYSDSGWYSTGPEDARDVIAAKLNMLLPSSCLK